MRIPVVPMGCSYQSRPPVIQRRQYRRPITTSTDSGWLRMVWACSTMTRANTIEKIFDRPKAGISSCQAGLLPQRRRELDGRTQPLGKSRRVTRHNGWKSNTDDSVHALYLVGRQPRQTVHQRAAQRRAHYIRKTCPDCSAKSHSI